VFSAGEFVDGRGAGRHQRPGQCQAADVLRVLLEVRVGEARAHRVRNDREPVLPQLATEGLQVRDESLQRNGAVGRRGAERAALVVQHEAVPDRKGIDGRPEVAVLGAPSAVQHHDRVAGRRRSSEFSDVEVRVVARLQVPVRRPVGEVLGVGGDRGDEHEQ